MTRSLHVHVTVRKEAELQPGEKPVTTVRGCALTSVHEKPATRHGVILHEEVVSVTKPYKQNVLPINLFVFVVVTSARLRYARLG